MMPKPIKGACLCGAVQYEVVPPTLFCVHCHCHFCRRAHAAAFVTWFGVLDDSFHIVSGGKDLRWYNSSKQSRRAFCSSCGTTLLFASDLCPGEMHIALATAITPIDREPKAHVFFDQHVPWFQIADSLPQLSTESKELVKYKDVEA